MDELLDGWAGWEPAARLVLGTTATAGALGAIVAWLLAQGAA